MHDNSPRSDDWLVDIEVDDVLANNRFWGQRAELAELLWENVRHLGGTPTSTEISQLIDRLTTLETDTRRPYVATQGPALC